MGGFVAVLEAFAEQTKLFITRFDATSIVFSFLGFEFFFFCQITAAFLFSLFPCSVSPADAEGNCANSEANK